MGQLQAWAKDVTEEVQTEVVDMNIWLKRIRNRVKLEVWQNLLGLKLPGHYRYYESEWKRPNAK